MQLLQLLLLHLQLLLLHFQSLLLHLQLLLIPLQLLVRLAAPKGATATNIRGSDGYQ